VTQPRNISGERGSASIWVLGFVAMIVAVTLVSIARGTAVLARHELESAADLTALAAAEQIGRSGRPCDAAGRIAIANWAVLARCTTERDPSGRSGTVTVSVTRTVRLPLIGARQVTARARAGRLAS